MATLSIGCQPAQHQPNSKEGRQMLTVAQALFSQSAPAGGVSGTMFDFFETTGVAVGVLVALLILLSRGIRSAWAFLKPKVEEAFSKHFALIDSLIRRNEQQTVVEEVHLQKLNEALTRRQACRIAEHHCDLIVAVSGQQHDTDSAVAQQVDRVKHELAKMKASDHG